MIRNSGFLGEGGEWEPISGAFSDAEVLGRSERNVYGRVSRYGKRWFFKGVNPEAHDVEAARRSLHKEFDIQIALEHPGVVRAVGFENIDDVGPCIITEWIEGKSLEDVLKGEVLPASERFRILCEIVDAVAYLHSQGVVHRDLKPSNIMIRNNGQSAVVVDFGLADTDAHLYQKMPAGTEGYASRRQYHAHTPYTGDDIHALGVIMQQLCGEQSAIARGCLAGKYATADALRAAFRQRRNRRRLTAGLSVGALFLCGALAVIIYMASLKDRVAEVQNANTTLLDSLTTISQQLDAERSTRLKAEQRQTEISNLKAGLKESLEREYVEFCNTVNQAEAEIDLRIQLMKQLQEANDDYMARNNSMSLNDAELIEIQAFYTKQFTTILERWNQQHSPYTPANSPE